MSGIEELRQRVTDAEERFGLINEQSAKYSKRLITLMNAIEGRILEQQDDVAQHKAEAERLQSEASVRSADVEQMAQENEQLRAMLHSLLKAIEQGNRDNLVETVQELDLKVSALVGDGASAAGNDEEEIAAEPASEDSAASADEVEDAEGDVSEDTGELAAPELAEEVIAVGPVSVAPVEELNEQPVDQMDEPAAQADEPMAEPEADSAEAVAEAEDAAEPSAAVDTPDAGEVQAQAMAEDDSEIAAEEAAEPPAEDSPEAAAEPASQAPGGDSLDEIMERVSKLVEETETTMAPDGSEESDAAAAEQAETAEQDSVEEMAQQAAAGA